MPVNTLAALERVFEVPVSGVIVIEHSLYARAHLDADIGQIAMKAKPAGLPQPRALDSHDT